MEPSVRRSLRNARLQLEEVCEALLHPSAEVVSRCELRLSAVYQELESSRPAWHNAAADRAAAAEATGVRRNFLLARRLLDNAGHFYEGWRKMRAVMTGQYGPDGSVAELRVPARVFVQG